MIVDDVLKKMDINKCNCISSKSFRKSFDQSDMLIILDMLVGPTKEFHETYMCLLSITCSSVPHTMNQ